MPEADGRLKGCGAAGTVGPVKCALTIPGIQTHLIEDRSYVEATEIKGNPAADLF
jgi:hypothetical protein